MKSCRNSSVSTPSCWASRSMAPGATMPSLTVGLLPPQSILREEFFMDINRLTEKAQEALRAAQSDATRQGHQQIDVEHLLLALLEQEGGLAKSVLEKTAVDPDLV